MAIIIETCPKCGHDLHDAILASNPPIPKKVCWNCGWSWTGDTEEVVRIPFGGNSLELEEQHIQEQIDKIFKPTEFNFYDYSKKESSPCDGCTNNPKNGGSGICHCILGQKVFY